MHPVHTARLSTILLTWGLLLCALPSAGCQEDSPSPKPVDGAPNVQVNLSADEYCAVWAEKHRAEICEPSAEVTATARAAPTQVGEDTAETAPRAEPAPSRPQATTTTSSAPRSTPSPQKSAGRRIDTLL